MKLLFGVAEILGLVFVVVVCVVVPSCRGSLFRVRKDGHKSGDRLRRRRREREAEKALHSPACGSGPRAQRRHEAKIRLERRRRLDRRSSSRLHCPADFVTYCSCAAVVPIPAVVTAVLWQMLLLLLAAGPAGLLVWKLPVVVVVIVVVVLVLTMVVARPNTMIDQHCMDQPFAAAAHTTALITPPARA